MNEISICNWIHMQIYGVLASWMNNDQNIDLEDIDLDDLHIDPFDDQIEVEVQKGKVESGYAETRRRKADFREKKCISVASRDVYKKSISYGDTAINLKGLKSLIALRSEHEQLVRFAEKARESGCELVFASEPTDEVKIGEDVKQQKLQEIPASTLKVEQCQGGESVYGDDAMLGQTRIAVIVSHQMRINYANYGRNVYYADILDKDSEDLNISHLCSDCNAAIGVFYGFSYEMQPIILALYCVFSPREEYSHIHLLFTAFMRATAGQNNEKCQRVTFNVQNLVDIDKLQCLADQYHKEAQRNALSMPVYTIALEPSLIQQKSFFQGQDIPHKAALEDLVRRLVHTESKQEFSSLKNQLCQLICSKNLGEATLRKGCTLQSFIETLFQSAEHLCWSQIKSMMGVCELYFKQHQGYREHAVREMREELINQCAQVYGSILQAHQPERVSAPALLYFTLAVVQKAAHAQAEDNNIKINENFKKLGQEKLTFLESEVPELAFIKQESSKLIFDYIVRELLECHRWEIPTESLLKFTHYFRLQVQQHDELYFQQYQAFPLDVVRIGSREYYRVTCDERWVCECQYSRLFGLPCRHILKVCLLTNTLIKNQIESWYLHEEYYQRCIMELRPLIDRYEAQKRKDQIILMPLGTEDGRQELVNYKTKHRMVGKAEYNM